MPSIGGFNRLVALPTGAVTRTPNYPISCASTMDPSTAAFQVFTPGCSNFYLGSGSSPSAWKYGYYTPFTSIAATFSPKGINPPLVLANTLSFSYFTPTSYNPCSGGLGVTSSSLIADVMNPILNDARPGLLVPSGTKFTWAGVASNYIAMGTSAVLQGGTVAGNSTGVKTGSSVATPFINTQQTSSSQRYPKARVWRTVGPYTN